MPSIDLPSNTSSRSFAAQTASPAPHRPKCPLPQKLGTATPDVFSYRAPRDHFEHAPIPSRLFSPYTEHLGLSTVASRSIRALPQWPSRLFPSRRPTPNAPSTEQDGYRIPFQRCIPTESDAELKCYSFGPIKSAPSTGRVGSVAQDTHQASPPNVLPETLNAARFLSQRHPPLRCNAKPFARDTVPNPPFAAVAPAGDTVRSSRKRPKLLNRVKQAIGSVLRLPANGGSHSRPFKSPKELSVNRLLPSSTSSSASAVPNSLFSRLDGILVQRTVQNDSPPTIAAAKSSGCAKAGIVAARESDGLPCSPQVAQGRSPLLARYPSIGQDRVFSCSPLTPSPRERSALETRLKALDRTVDLAALEVENLGVLPVACRDVLGRTLAVQERFLYRKRGEVYWSFGVVYELWKQLPDDVLSKCALTRLRSRFVQDSILSALWDRIGNTSHLGMTRSTALLIAVGVTANSSPKDSLSWVKTLIQPILDILVFHAEILPSVPTPAAKSDILAEQQGERRVLEVVYEATQCASPLKRRSSFTHGGVSTSLAPPNAQRRRISDSAFLGRPSISTTGQLTLTQEIRLGILCQTMDASLHMEFGQLSRQFWMDIINSPEIRGPLETLGDAAIRAVLFDLLVEEANTAKIKQVDDLIKNALGPLLENNTFQHIMIEKGFYEHSGDHKFYGNALEIVGGSIYVHGGAIAFRQWIHAVFPCLVRAAIKAFDSFHREPTQDELKRRTDRRARMHPRAGEFDPDVVETPKAKRQRVGGRAIEIQQPQKRRRNGPVSGRSKKRAAQPVVAVENEGSLAAGRTRSAKGRFDGVQAHQASSPSASIRIPRAPKPLASLNGVPSGLFTFRMPPCSTEWGKNNYMY